MIWQDMVFMIGGFIFAPSLWFMIRAKDKPPVKSSLPTALVLTAFVITYITMGFWLATISTALTALCWFVLLAQRLSKGGKE